MTYDASYKKKSGTKLHFWNKVTFSQVLWKHKEGDSMLYKVCITKSYFHRYEMNQVSTKSKHFLPQRGKKKDILIAVRYDLFLLFHFICNKVL